LIVFAKSEWTARLTIFFGNRFWKNFAWGRVRIVTADPETFRMVDGRMVEALNELRWDRDGWPLMDLMELRDPPHAGRPMPSQS